MSFSIKIKNTFTNILPADKDLGPHRRQVLQAAYSWVTPKVPTNPQLIHISKGLAETLGFNPKELNSKLFLEVFSGSKVYLNTKPYAMAYAGHQFGHWAGQLGDGRAINLFEIESQNKIWAIQLKGAGATPYSRQGDGLAVLRSSVREYLCSEAMFHLGVPTTRALSLITTGDQVLRDVMYNGNAAYEKGAIVCRVAPTFIRFGNFELFAARQDIANLKKIADYTIRQFFPELGELSKSTYINFFKSVVQKTLDMIIHWQRVGFVHGVMNTDNMSVLGLTIDYGPYGWLEGFDYDWTPNTTDAENRRYRYGNQPNIALWNLLQLANALYPLVEATEPFEDILNQYKIDFEVKYIQMMRSKLGLAIDLDDDQLLISRLEKLLLEQETDMTIFFRELTNYEGHTFEDVLCKASYKPEDLSDKLRIKWQQWFKDYDDRLKKESLKTEDRQQHMKQVNPKYVLRNYMAQLAIDEAEKGDYSLIDELFQLLRQPYAEQPQFEKWYAKRPEWARHKMGCSMLSCSS